MRRSFLTLAVAAVFGLFLSVGDASACHKKKACATPVACPEPAPCPAPEPCAPKKKCHLFGGHKKKCHQPAMVCETAAPVWTEAPVYPTGQAMPSAQGF